MPPLDFPSRGEAPSRRLKFSAGGNSISRRETYELHQQKHGFRLNRSSNCGPIRFDPMDSRDRWTVARLTVGALPVSVSLRAGQCGTLSPATIAGADWHRGRDPQTAMAREVPAARGAARRARPRGLEPACAARRCSRKSGTARRALAGWEASHTREQSGHCVGRCQAVEAPC